MNMKPASRTAQGIRTTRRMIFGSLLLLLLFMNSVVVALSSNNDVNNKKIALISGSNKGIGLEIARKLGKDKNFICILACRNPTLGQEAANQLQREGMDAAYVSLNLQNDETIQAAASFVEETYGRCDVLINNAAVCFNDPTLYGKVPHTPFDEQAKITVNTNFFGTLALTQAMIPLLNKSESPRIINIASSAGRLSILPSKERQAQFSSPTLQLDELKGYMNDFVKAAKDGTHQQQGWPNTGYGVSKVGIIAVTKLLARENPEFMVNSVDPGYCATDQNNNQGFIPAERGAVTPFLLSTLPDEKHLTGMHWYQEQEIEW